MYNNNQNGNYPQGGYQPGVSAVKQKKEKINTWEGIGVVFARSANNGDPIKFFPFPNGGGAIHILVKCTEYTGTNDENGNPKMRTTSIPVNVVTNKNITMQQLQNVTPGMKVHVVGKLNVESYTDKVSGAKKSSLVVNAYVFEILSQAEYTAQQPMYGQQAAVFQNQPYPAPGFPAYPPQQGQQAPAYYQPAGQMPQQMQQASQIPPYYQPTGQMPQAPRQQPAGVQVPPQAQQIPQGQYGRPQQGGQMPQQPPIEMLENMQNVA